MSKDITEYIDDFCRDKYGHTNWSYLSSLCQMEREQIDTCSQVEEVDYSSGIVIYKGKK